MIRHVLVPALVLGWFALAAPARADDGLTSEEIIREEIRAYYADRPDDAMRAYWKNGLTIETADKRFQVGVHGRIMLDLAFFHGVDEGLEQAFGAEIHSGWRFRRAWLTVNGRAFRHFTWMAQYAFELVDGPGFLDVWVGMADLQECLGCSFPDFRIGHYQEPFGLAWLTSSKVFQLMAWPTPTTTFTPGYNSGIEFNRQWFGDRVTARVGFFGHASNFAGIHNWTDGYGVTGRVTWLPWAPCDCDCRVFHLGLSASYRGEIRDARFRTRADLDIGPSVIDTGTFAASEAMLVDFEAAWVYDRFNVQAEATLVQVEAETGTDPLFWGAYLQAGYQIFGSPCRTWSRKTASFGAAKVKCPLLGSECRGGGAWEVAARISYVDLDDGDKQGGALGDIAVGLNWYLVSNARVMLNYIWGDVDNALGTGTDGDFGAFAVRFQVHW